MKHTVRGFTLIELSIVLVIIGLIVGGILVGQNLIAAAALRAQITQIEKYNTAVSTFFGKYGYLPGDIPNTPATTYGFASRPAGYPGQGDGNGVLEGCDAESNSSYLWVGLTFACETVGFWVDLSSAKMIDGSFTAGATQLSGGTVPSSPNVSAYIPQAKIGQGSYIIAMSSQQVNYFGITGVTSLNGTYNASGAVPGLITPLQAYAMDKKVDDGLPLTGSVQAMDLSEPANDVNFGNGIFTPAVGTTASNCITNPSGPFTNTYNISTTNSALPSCSLAFKFQ